jgi:hypothetical protein
MTSYLKIEAFRALAYAEAFLSEYESVKNSVIAADKAKVDIFQKNAFEHILQEVATGEKVRFLLVFMRKPSVAEASRRVSERIDEMRNDANNHTWLFKDQRRHRYAGYGAIWHHPRKWPGDFPYWLRNTACTLRDAGRSGVDVCMAVDSDEFKVFKWIVRKQDGNAE